MNHSSVEQYPDTPGDASAAAPATEQLLDGIDAAMHRMGRLMAARHAEFQASSGMATPQFMVLKTLACEGPARISDIAGLLGVKNPAASMLVQHLEAEGLVERRHDEADNRAVIVSLTAVGEDRLCAAEVFRRELLRRMTADLTDTDLEDLRRIISTIADTVARGD